MITVCKKVYCDGFSSIGVSIFHSLINNRCHFFQLPAPRRLRIALEAGEPHRVVVHDK